MSATVSMVRDATQFVAALQAPITNCVADYRSNAAHKRRMLGHDELIAELRRRRDEGEFTNADMARVLGLPTSRIADIFATDRKPRRVTVDEMKILVEHFQIEPPALPLPPELADRWLSATERERHRAMKMLETFLDDAAAV